MNNYNKLGGINNNHYFLMRDKILPIWEDPKNINGGCISIKLEIYKVEEIWNKLGNTTSVTIADFPKINESYLVEDEVNYPVSFNGKMRFKIALPVEMSKDEIEAEVMKHQKTAHYLDGKTPKKVIVVPKRIVNIVM